MFMPWWRVRDMVINPAMVARVDFRDDIVAGQKVAYVYLAATKPSGGGMRVTVDGRDAVRLQRFVHVLTGERGGQQLGYYFSADDGDNHGSDGLRDAA